MKINAVALVVFCVPAWSADLVVYPPSIELTGRNATQVLAVSLGGRDVTAECTFTPVNRALMTVSKDAVVTAQADGKSSLRVSCDGMVALAPVKIAAAKSIPPGRRMLLPKRGVNFRMPYPVRFNARWTSFRPSSARPLS